MLHLASRRRSQPGPEVRTLRAHARERGQVLAIFAVSIFVFVGILAIVVDVSWYWANTLRVQRAADAAALAGVVWLPGNVAQGITTAQAEATKNGYTDGATVNGGTVSVTPTQDGSNDRQLDVTVTAPVNTFFMRLFGINSITASRTSKAEYVLPVPMGSPQNYYGDFGLVRHPGGGYTKTTSTDATLGPLAATATHAPSNWATPTNAYTSNDSYATETTANDQQGWSTFNLTGYPGSTVIDGIEVLLEVKSSVANCRVSAALSYNNGTNYTTAQTLTGLTTSDQTYILGSPTDKWGRASWTTTELNNANFVVRLQDADSCGAHTLSLDQLQVRVSYHYPTSTFILDSNLTDPYANGLAPQGFWGTIISQGAASINGDIYAPYYDTRTSRTNPNYSTNYYNYDVEMPAGSSSGELWIYDAPFCAGGGAQYGTGDRWFSGNAGTSAFYDLYDSKLTVDTGDDTLVWSSGNTFKETATFSDPDMSGSGGTSCARSATVTAGQGAPGPDGYGTICTASLTSAIDCHLRWFKIPATLAGGKVYRLSVSSTDPNNASAQLSADGHNSFAFWSTASGGTPRIYGVGAMETFEPLPGGGASIFYLAQIDSVHAGKTMVVRLWDPGDTNPLPASLKILQPTTTGYLPTTFSWRAQKVNSNGQACTTTGTGVTSVTTNVGSTTGTFNGCWLIITIPLPSSYAAPQPPGETHGGGWWKIEYDMGGSSASNAVDLTTFQVDLLGNPVHLVVP